MGNKNNFQQYRIDSVFISLKTSSSILSTKPLFQRNNKNMNTTYTYFKHFKPEVCLLLSWFCFFTFRGSFADVCVSSSLKLHLLSPPLKYFSNSIYLIRSTDTESSTLLSAARYWDHKTPDAVTGFAQRFLKYFGHNKIELQKQLETMTFEMRLFGVLWTFASILK